VEKRRRIKRVRGRCDHGRMIRDATLLVLKMERVVSQEIQVGFGKWKRQGNVA